MTRHAEQVVLQPAYVLHGRPYRETSALLELFSAEYGRVSVVARGVRGAKSSRGALLQPFRPLLVSWKGKGGLATLTEAEAAGRAIGLAGTALISGFYLNELLQRLLSRHDPQLMLFSLYDATLRQLAELSFGHPYAQLQLENQLRRFEQRLIEAAGYGVHFGCEVVVGEELECGRSYIYVAERGVVPSEQAPGAGIEVSGATLLALASDATLVGEGLREAKRLMRTVLMPYLGDRPLHSRELMRQVMHGNSSERSSTTD